MDDSIKNLFATLSKGGIKAKFEAYKTLLLSHSENEEICQKMRAQLIRERSPNLFEYVHDFDSQNGDVLNWSEVLKERIQSCKYQDARTQALNSSYNYGPNSRYFLSELVLFDPEYTVHNQAFKVLLSQNEGSSDSYFIDLSRKYFDRIRDVERDDAIKNNSASVAASHLWGLGYSKALHSLLLDELVQENKVLLKGLGSVFVKFHDKLKNDIKLIETEAKKILDTIEEQEKNAKVYGFKFLFNLANKKLYEENRHTATHFRQSDFIHFLADLFTKNSAAPRKVWPDSLVSCVAKIATRTDHPSAYLLHHDFTSYCINDHPNQTLGHELIYPLLADKNIDFEARRRWIADDFAEKAEGEGMSEQDLWKTIAPYIKSDKKKLREFLRQRQKSRIEKKKNN